MASYQHNPNAQSMALALQGMHAAPHVSRGRVLRARAFLAVARCFLAPFRLLFFILRPIVRGIDRILPDNEVWRRRTISFTTAGISVAAWALVSSWSFAIGLIGLLAVHELGHAWQIRRAGGEASSPIFIPFLGAFIAATSLGKDIAAEARVALAGPIAGTAAIAVPALAWLATGAEIFHALTFVGVFFNLFNLLPVSPLDGGRVAGILPAWFNYLGVAGGMVGGILSGHLILTAIALIGVSEVLGRRSKRASDEQRAFYAISAIDRLKISAVYLALAALLGVAAWLTYFPLDQITG